MNNVLITGVSTGMGRAAAEYLVARGYRVFGSVRRAEDARALRERLGDNFTPLLFDVADEAAVKAGLAQVTEALAGAGLDALVNNAGMAVSGPLMYLSAEDLRRQFDVNVFGLMNVTRAALPLLGAREGHTHPPGRILNISSVGGRLAFPFLGAYTSSKHALEALSDTLRRELRIWGIDVIVLQPGSVRTEIWDKAEAQDLSPYARTPYGPILEKFREFFIAQGRKGLAPEVMARLIQHVIETPRPKARYAAVPDYVSGWVLPRLMPDRWLDALVGKQLGLERRRP
ncbi:SDR family oxidoreductase [Archangium violaceum]|uniref:SDR family oxidoreductase n=1 Tax=Archangium violaceum TaxID=83451 RepID=UPI00194DDED9|nr:SDR family oxidoreductase [Archangium violaceum]QRN93590.1 SDR family oxidoreductase [Archangium violaceum]